LYVNTIGFWQQIRSDLDRVSCAVRTKPDVVDAAKFGGPIFGFVIVGSIICLQADPYDKSRVNNVESLAK